MTQLEPAARVVLIPVDKSSHSDHAVSWVSFNFKLPSDDIHLMTVIAPSPDPSTVGAFSAPLALASADVLLDVDLMDNARDRCEQEEAERVGSARELLREYENQLNSMHLENPHWHASAGDSDAFSLKVTKHVSMDGASTGQAVVEYAEKIKADLVVVGSRGLGSIHSNFLGLFGLGSVSDYLVHHLHCPTLVVRLPPAAAPAPSASTELPGGTAAARRVVLAVDDSEHSARAAEWAGRVLLPCDEVHVVTVLTAMPYPAAQGQPTLGYFPPEMALEVPDFATIDPKALEVWDEEEDIVSRVLRAKQVLDTRAGEVTRAFTAFNLLADARDAASTVTITTRVLMDAYTAGSAVVKYAQEKQADLVVVGSRGLGSIESNLMGLFGLGSVSDYLLHHLQCPTLVVNSTPEALCASSSVAATLPDAQGLAKSETEIAAACGTSGAAGTHKGRVVLLAVDASAHSERAVAWAASRLVQADDHVHLATVLAPQQFPPSIAVSGVRDWAPEDAARVGQSETTLRSLAHQLLSAHTSAQPISGTPTAKINVKMQLLMDANRLGPGPILAQYADAKQVDLVVVGSRGLGSIQSNIMSFFGLGSVSDYLVERLRCPVVVVRLQDTQHLQEIDSVNSELDQCA